MKIVNKILIISLIFSLILYTVCRLFGLDNFAAGIFSGYLIIVLNFIGLSRKVAAMLEGRAGTTVVLNTQFRLVLTGFAIYVFIKHMSIDVFGLLVGLSVLPLCIPIVVIYNYYKGRD